MRRYISEFIISKNFMFTFHDGELNDLSVIELLRTGTIAGYVDSDFTFIKFENNELIKQKINYNIDDHVISGTIDLDNLSINDFDYHNLIEILGEKVFSKTFFSHDADYEDENLYFIFTPFRISKNKKKIMLYPIVEIINKEFVSVTLTSYSDDKEYTIDELSDEIFRINDKIDIIEYPKPYFLAWGIFEELKDTKDNEIFFESSQNRCDSIFEVAEMLVYQIMNTDKYSWSSRTLVSTDLIDITANEISLLQKGFHNNNSNPLYEIEVVDFSESDKFKYFIYSQMSITIGDIKEAYMPAKILTKEISMITTKLVGLSKIDKQSSIAVLLDAKVEIEELKQRVYYKYNSLLSVHKIMNHTLVNLLGIDQQIEKIDSLIEVYYRKQEYKTNRNNNILQIILGLVSLLLSLGAIFDYIVKPIYEIKYKIPMPPEDILLNFTLILFATISVVFLLIVSYKLFSNKKNKKK